MGKDTLPQNSQSQGVGAGTLAPVLVPVRLSPVVLIRSFTARKDPVKTQTVCLLFTSLLASSVGNSPSLLDLPAITL